jgi:hypothetical protein
MQSEVYSRHQAAKANLSLSDLGLTSWADVEIKNLQQKVGAKPVDGWFGPKSIAAWKAWKRKNDPQPVVHAEPTNTPFTDGTAIINGMAHPVPDGLKFVNYLEPNGIPAEMNDTSPRKHEVTQFVFHRGAEGKRKGENYAQATERILDARGLSTTFSMDTDGTIYQHFDPAIRRGRHATHHNVQSDSIDIGGPFSQKTKPVAGQKPLTVKMAIGRKNDGKPPLKRSYGTVKCWSLTPEQERALVLFVPWWCKLRGIPLTACEDWRTMRIGGVGVNDPVTNVKGLLAHTQISGPGQRVDGILPLMVLREADTEIEWRSAENFFG